MSTVTTKPIVLSSAEDRARLAIALWNSLPYDHATCQAYCPKLEDMERAVEEATKRLDRK